MYYLLKSKETECWLKLINGKPTFVEQLKNADFFEKKHVAESYLKELSGLELWEMTVDLKKVEIEEEGLKTLDGKLYLYTEMGDISDFVFLRKGQMAYHAVYSIHEAETITIYNPDKTEVLWSGSAKGKNRKAMVATGCKGLSQNPSPQSEQVTGPCGVFSDTPRRLKPPAKAGAKKALDKIKKQR